MSTMHAAQLFGPGDLRISEVTAPSPGAGEILLTTAAASVCGSDLRMIANGYRGVDEDHPLTLGHEFSGTITALGEGVTGYEVGARVAVAPNYGCGVCEWCVGGMTHLCPSYQAFGINIPGAFAQQVLVPAAPVAQGNVLTLTDDVSFEVASLYEPMSCVVNAQERLAVGQNDTVLIVGAGPIGLMHALLARARGAARVLMTDRAPQRLEISTEIAPFIEVLANAEDLAAGARAATGGRGIDVAIVAAPAPSAQAEVIEAMAMNGRVMYFGGLPASAGPVPVDTNLIHYQQLVVTGTARASVSQYRAVAGLVSSGQIDLAPLVSRSFPLAEIGAAVEFASSGQGIKTVISFA